MPALNLATEPDSALHVPTYLVTLLGKYLCYALLAHRRSTWSGAIAASLSLGHGAFFALGGYAMGMYLMRQIGARGVYGNPELAGLHGVPELEGVALVSGTASTSFPSPC